MNSIKELVYLQSVYTDVKCEMAVLKAKGREVPQYLYEQARDCQTQMQYVSQQIDDTLNYTGKE